MFSLTGVRDSLSETRTEETTWMKYLGVDRRLLKKYGARVQSAFV